MPGQFFGLSDSDRLSPDDDNFWAAYSERDFESVYETAHQEEIGYEGFGVAEITEISGDEVATVTSAEDEGQQVEWSPEESQELLDEVSAESTREDSVEENGERMDDAVHESQ